MVEMQPQFQLSVDADERRVARFVSVQPKRLNYAFDSADAPRLSVKLIPGSTINTPEKRTEREKKAADQLGQYLLAMKEFLRIDIDIEEWWRTYNMLEVQMPRGIYNKQQIKDTYQAIEDLFRQLATELHTAIVDGSDLRKNPYAAFCKVVNARKLWISRCMQTPSWVHWVATAYLRNTSDNLYSRLRSIFTATVSENEQVQAIAANYTARVLLLGASYRSTNVLLRLKAIKEGFLDTPIQKVADGYRTSFIMRLEQALVEMGSEENGLVHLDLSSTPSQDFSPAAFYLKIRKALAARNDWLRELRLRTNLLFPDCSLDLAATISSRAFTARMAFFILELLQNSNSFISDGELDRRKLQDMLLTNYVDHMNTYHVQLCRKAETPPQKYSSDLARGAYLLNLMLGSVDLSQQGVGKRLPEKELLNSNFWMDMFNKNNECLRQILTCIFAANYNAEKDTLSRCSLMRGIFDFSLESGHGDVSSSLAADYFLSIYAPRYRSQLSKTMEAEEKFEEWFQGSILGSSYKMVDLHGKFKDLLKWGAVLQDRVDKAQKLAAAVTRSTKIVFLGAPLEVGDEHSVPLPNCILIPSLDVVDLGLDRFRSKDYLWSSAQSLISINPSSREGNTNATSGGGLFTGLQLVLLELLIPVDPDLNRQAVRWSDIVTKYNCRALVADMRLLVESGKVLWAPKSPNATEFGLEDLFAISADWLGSR